MFGKKKSEPAAGERRQDRSEAPGENRGYYRQEDYYTQHSSGGSYYDLRAYTEENPRRRDYARPGYDRRYVNMPENRGTGSGRDEGRYSQSASRE